jgi:hypothetical protein
MTTERVAALEAVPGWAWGEGAEASWQQKLASLRAHVAEHGRLPPCKCGPGLGGWMIIQRTAKKASDAGEPRGNKMTPERAAALEAVPGWAWEVDAEAAWQEKLAAVKGYAAAHGRLPAEGAPVGLGRWIAGQRAAKRAADAGEKRSGKMTPECAAALEGVPGWRWEGGMEDTWPEKLAALKAFVGVHGRLPSVSHPSGLGTWVSRQRAAKKAADAGKASNLKMTPARAAALEAVPGWAWDTSRKRARA